MINTWETAPTRCICGPGWISAKASSQLASRAEALLAVEVSIGLRALHARYREHDRRGATLPAEGGVARNDFDAGKIDPARIGLDGDRAFDVDVGELDLRLP